jgi:DNA polymerase-3 subunit gamma/tau
MSYQVLARKWRPRIFSEMVGQDHVVRALSNALDNDRLHHAYLFTGTRGVGKTTLARIFAKSLNCEHGVGSTPCGQCSICRQIDEGRFVDLLEVDAASRTKVDQTRELLDNVPYAPVGGRYKVYLIDEVHMFSSSSFNALLKTLEEPPPHVKFLLATTDPQKVPLTVLSRCLQFNLKRLPFDQIRDYLQQILEKEGIAHERPALGLLARGADGSMRDALSLMDQAIAFCGGQVTEQEVRSMLGAISQDRVHALLAALAAQAAAEVMQQVAGLAEMAPDFSGVLQDLLSLLHRVALVQTVPEALDDSAGDLEQVQRLARQLTPEEVQLFYQIALIGQRDLPLAPDPRSGFEMILLRMLAFRPEMEVTTAAPATAPERSAGSGSPKRVKTGNPETRPPGTNPRGVGARLKPEPAPEGASPPKPVMNVDLTQWHQIVGSLKLGGIALQLASNCVFESWDGNQLELRIDPAHVHLKVESSQQRLCKALEALLGTRLGLVIEVDKPATDTPARLQEKARDERQRVAEERIAGDPLVKNMEEKFGARLIPGSVRPLDE